MTEQSTPSDLAAWVLDHGVGLTPARQKQLAKGYRRLEAQTDIRGRAVVMYRERAREAEAQVEAWRKQYEYDTARLWDDLDDADDDLHEAEAERDEWRQTALDERGAALDALEQIKARDARIKAVRELHRSVGLTAYTGPRIKPSGEPIPDDTQVCDYCTDPDELGWCEYPCPTIRALDGDA